MEFKLPLLVSAVASALTFNAHASSTPIASGNHIKIAAEDIFQTGQLFNSSLVTAAANRAIYRHSNGTMTTVAVNANGELNIESRQKLTDIGSKQFVLSADGQTLVYVFPTAANKASVVLSIWNQDTKQWDSANTYTLKDIAGLPRTLHLEQDLLSVGFEDNIKFMRLDSSAQELRYVTEVAAKNHIAIHPIKNSRQLFIENSPSKTQSNRLGRLIEVNVFDATIQEVAHLTLDEKAADKWRNSQSQVHFDGRLHVAAIASNTQDADIRFFHFDGEMYQQGNDARLPSQIDGISLLNNGVFIGQVDGQVASNIHASQTAHQSTHSDKVTPAFVDAMQVNGITNSFIFSDNFSRNRETSEVKALTVASYNAATNTVSATKTYENGTLEARALDATDYYKPSRNTNNHWMVYPTRHSSELLDATNPANSLALGSYYLETCADLSCQNVGKNYFAMNEHLFAFRTTDYGLHWIEQGVHKRNYINDAGEMVSGSSALQGNNEEFYYFEAFPMPAYNGVLFLTDIEAMLYKVNDAGELQRFARLAGHFESGQRVVADAKGILLVDNSEQTVSRFNFVETGGSSLQPVTLEAGYPNLGVSNASSYGRYLYLTTVDSVTHTYVIDDDGNYSLYSSSVLPCDCILENSRRLTETQAFTVKNGQFLFYALNLETKAWQQVEAHVFAETIDIEGFDKQTYFGKNSSAIRRYDFEVAPTLERLPNAIEVEINTTKTVDLSTYIADANPSDVHTYTVSNSPDYATLQGATLSLSPTTGHQPATIELTVTDSGGLTTDFSLAIELNGQPVLRDAPPRIVDRNTLLNGTLADIVYDPDGGELTFTSAPDSALAVDANGAYMGSFSNYGEYVVKATAKDSEQHAVEVQQTIIVNAKPTALTLDEVVITQGELYSGSLAFAVSDADNDALIYSTAPNSAIPVALDGSFSGVISDFGKFEVSAIAKDRVGQTVMVTRPVHVNAPPVAVDRAALMVASNTEITGSLVSNVSDSDSTTLTFTSLPDSALTVDSNGDFTGRFSAAGTYVVKARVSDEHGASTLVTQTVVVTGGAAYNTPEPIWVNPEQTVVGDLSHALVAANGQSLIFSTAEGSALTVDSNGQFSGQFDASGTYEVRAKATDANATTIDIVQVIRVNSAPEVRDLQAVSAFVADVIHIDIAAKFTDKDEHALVITANDLPEGLSLNSNGLLVGKLASEGDYNIRFTATDSMGLAVSADLTLRVSNTQLRTKPDNAKWRSDKTQIQSVSLFQSGFFEGSGAVAMQGNRVITRAYGIAIPNALITSEINDDGQISVHSVSELPSSSANAHFVEGERTLAMSEDGNTIAYILRDDTAEEISLNLATWDDVTKAWKFVSAEVISNDTLHTNNISVAIAGDFVTAITVSMFGEMGVNVYTRHDADTRMTKVATVSQQLTNQVVESVALMPESEQLLILFKPNFSTTASEQASLFTIDTQAKQVTLTSKLALTEDELAVAQQSATKMFFDRTTRTYFYYAPYISSSNKISAYRINVNGTIERLDSALIPSELNQLRGVKDGVLAGRIDSGEIRAYSIETANNLSISRISEVLDGFGRALNTGSASRDWVIVDNGTSTVTFKIDQEHDNIQFKHRHLKGDIDGPSLGTQRRLISLTNVVGRILVDKDEKALRQLSTDGLGSTVHRVNYDLNRIFGTSVPTELLSLGDFLYATYDNMSAVNAVGVNVMKIHADENGKLIHSEQRLLDEDGTPLTSAAFRFFEAPSMGGLVVSLGGKLMLYKQTTNGDLAFAASLDADFARNKFMDDGKGLTYWDEDTRRLDRIEYNQAAQQLVLRSSAYDIPPPQSEVYVADGYLQFSFVVSSTLRTQLYILNENGVYERKYAGVVPCLELVRGETIFAKDRGYCYSASTNTLSTHYLDSETYAWRELDTFEFKEHIENFDQATKSAYGKIGTWVRRYTFKSAPVLVRSIEPLHLVSDTTVNVDLASYVSDTDDNETLSYAVTNLPLNAALQGSQLTLTGDAELNGYSIDATVTDSQGFTLDFTLPVLVNKAPVLGNSEPIVTDKNQTVQGTLATLVSDPEGDALTFTTLEGSALPVSATGEYQGAFSTYGVHTVKAKAEDTLGASVIVQQTIVVNSLPQSESLEMLVVAVGDNLSGSLAAGVSDADGDELLFSTNAESDFAIASDGSYTGSTSNAGVYIASALATDPLGRSATATQNVKVNAAPVVSSLPQIVVEVGDTVSGNWSNAVSDANGDALVFTSSTDSVLPVSASGAFSGVMDNAGTFAVKATVADPHGASAAISQTVVVNEKPVPVTMDDITVENGEAVSVDFKTIFPQGSALTFTAQGLPSGIVLSEGGILSGSTTQAGVYNVTVTATNSHNEETSVSFALTVKAAPVPVTMDDISLQHGGSVSVDFKTVFPEGSSLTFTATGLPNGITLTTDGVLSGSSTQAGDHNITVTATNAQGQISTVSFKLTVAAKPTPPPPTGGNNNGGSSGGSLLWLLGLLPFTGRIRRRKS